MVFICNNCGFNICRCDVPGPSKPPPNVINFDGRSLEARRIADLEKRIVELETTVEQLELEVQVRRAREVALNPRLVTTITWGNSSGDSIT